MNDSELIEYYEMAFESVVLFFAAALFRWKREPAEAFILAPPARNQTKQTNRHSSLIQRKRNNG